MSDGEFAYFADGFCRADVNRCLAAELERRSESLAAAPRSRRVRDALREESRLRLQAGALELGHTLGAYADGCGAEKWASSEDSGIVPAVNRHYECVERLEQGYAAHAVSHLASMSMRLADLLELEAQAAAQASDALSPGMASSSQGYVDALWGAGGIRTAVAESLMGRMEGDVGYGRSEAGVPAYGNEAAYPDRVERDERVSIAMRLMVVHQVPFNASLDGSGRVTFHPLDAIPAASSDANFGGAVYNLLDHRLAYIARTPPYDLGQVTDQEWAADWPDAGSPLPVPEVGVAPGSTLTLAELEAFEELPLETSALRRFVSARLAPS